MCLLTWLNSLRSAAFVAAKPVAAVSTRPASMGRAATLEVSSCRRLLLWLSTSRHRAGPHRAVLTDVFNAFCLQIVAKGKLRGRQTAPGQQQM